MPVIAINHPLIAHKLGLLRNRNTDLQQFRALTAEIGRLMTYEMTRHLSTQTTKIETWNGPIEVPQLAGKSPTLVPILRAGMGLLNGVLDILPNAPISMVGMKRNEETLIPTCYYQNLVHDIQEREALIVDPMLATGGSLLATIELLKANGCQKITAMVLIAAPEGISRLTAAHPEIDLYTAAIDHNLNDNGYIVPGLGDAGDRLFGTT